MEANEPAYILATSGTTAKPKLAVHTHGGYQVHIASMGRWCFGLKPSRRLVGDLRHRLDRRPQLHGLRAAASPAARRSRSRARSTTRRPDANWRTAIEEFGVTGIFTSPTAVRMLMRYGERHARRRRSLPARAHRLRRRGAQPARVGVAAEPRARRPRARCSTTCGRPRPAARCSATRTASSCCRSSPGRPRIPLPGIEAAS